jgi:uncharacterized membrane protein (UPF0136 family)
MIDVTKIYYFIFGALTIVGGVMGFVKKASKISLIAGGLCGVLLLIAGLMLRDKPQAGLILGGVVSLALAAQFLPAFLNKLNWMPAGMMTVLSILGIIATLVGFAKR